jgi:hypothetical protein
MEALFAIIAIIGGLLVLDVAALKGGTDSRDLRLNERR